MIIGCACIVLHVCSIPCIFSFSWPLLPGLSFPRPLLHIPKQGKITNHSKAKAQHTHPPTRQWSGDISRWLPLQGPSSSTAPWVWHSRWLFCRSAASSFPAGPGVWLLRSVVQLWCGCMVGGGGDQFCWRNCLQSSPLCFLCAPWPLVVVPSGGGLPGCHPRLFWMVCLLDSYHCCTQWSSDVKKYWCCSQKFLFFFILPAGLGGMYFAMWWWKNEMCFSHKIFFRFFHSFQCGFLSCGRRCHY